MGKGTFKAYEKGEWGRDVVGAWGIIKSLTPTLSHRERERQVIRYLHKIYNECSLSFQERVRER
jgi:hypothetical protein